MKTSLLVFNFLLTSLIVLGAQVSLGAEKSRLALNWKPEPQFGGFYAAELGGHFKKNGLAVEIRQGGAGTPVVQMLAAGQVEFGIVSADEIVISRARGGDVTAVFAAYQTNPQGLMVHEARGFKSVGDVFANEGTLAVQKGLPYAMFLQKKYPNGKAKIVPYLGGIQNFLADPRFSQQCFVTAEPIAASKQGIKTKVFLVADEGYNPYTTVLAVREEFVKKNPKLVKAMVAAVRAGWADYLAKPEATNAKMAELNKSMDAATFVESAKAQKSLIETTETKKNGLGTMSEERWKQLSQQLLELKVIDKAPDAKTLFSNL